MDAELITFLMVSPVAVSLAAGITSGYQALAAVKGYPRWVIGATNVFCVFFHATMVFFLLIHITIGFQFSPDLDWPRIVLAVVVYLALRASFYIGRIVGIGTGSAAAIAPRSQQPSASSRPEQL